MLAQIEARLQRLAEEIRMAKEKAKGAAVEGAKTVGVLLEPMLYARLKNLAEARGVSLKTAAIVAIEEGLRALRF